MRPVSAGFEAALRAGSHRAVSRVSVLRADLSTELVLTGETGVVTGGSVSTDRARRRTVTLELVDETGEWAPAVASDALFPNRLVRLERGIMVGDAPELVSLGVFLVDRPTTTVGPAGATIRISGQDRLKLALRSAFTVPARYEEGVAVADVVRSVAQAAGMGDTLYRLDDGGAALGADRTYEVGYPRLDAIRGLATDFALDLYVDADGYLVLEPASTAATLPDPSWTFAAGDEALMLGVTKDLSDDRLYNHTLVSGEAADLPPVRGEARDLNPASPAYNPPDGTGPIGDRLYTYVSAMIRSEEQAQAVADALLLDVALVEEAITLPAITHPALEAGDVVAIAESTARIADDYLIETLTIPLGTAEMTMTSGKLRSLA